MTPKELTSGAWRDIIVVLNEGHSIANRRTLRWLQMHKGCYDGLNNVKPCSLKNKCKTQERGTYYVKQI